MGSGSDRLRDGSPAVSAALAAKLLGKRAVIKLGAPVGYPGSFSYSRKSVLGRLKLAALRILSPRFAAVNPELIEESRESGFYGPSVALIPNGVDTRRCRPPRPEERAEARAED